MKYSPKQVIIIFRRQMIRQKIILEYVCGIFQKLNTVTFKILPV